MTRRIAAAVLALAALVAMTATSAEAKPAQNWTWTG